MASFAFDSDFRKKLEDEFIDIGKKLLCLPSSDNDLSLLLEEAEGILVRVPQELARPKTDFLIPLMTALLNDKIFRHADVNIQVAVASCLNEITRLTAPTFPYFDYQMKEIFELFMVALKQLSSTSGRNYERAQLILETLASVRSCVMMLDININATIDEMFRFFFSTIRSNHSSDIFNHMGTIMSTIIEESDDVPLQLLKPLLDSVSVDNKKISPTSWELGKTVLEKCATKLQPFLRKAVKYLNLKVDDYDEIIASQWAITSNGQNMSFAMQSFQANYKSVFRSSSSITQPNTNVEKTALSGDGFSTMNINSETEPKEDKNRVDNKNHSEKSADIVQLKNNHASEKSADIVQLKNNHASEKSADIVQLKNNHANINIDLVNNSEIVQSEKDRGAGQSIQDKKSEHLIKPKEGCALTLTRGGIGNNTQKDLVLGLDYGRTGFDYEVTFAKRGRPKKQKNAIKSEKGDGNDKVTSGKRGRPRKEKSTIILEKGDDNQGDHNKMVEFPVCNAAPIEEETPDGSSVEYGVEMVNLRIMVWWPLDRLFYSGTVVAFNPLTKKHKIIYDDNEEEVLNLNKERWRLLDDNESKSSCKQGSGLSFPANEPVKTREKIVKTKTREQHAIPSSKRSKSEGSIVHTKDEAEVTHKSKSSLEAEKKEL